MKNWIESIPDTNNYNFTLFKDGQRLIETDKRSEFVEFMEKNFPEAQWVPPYGAKRVEFFETNKKPDLLDMTLTPYGKHSYLYEYSI